MTTNSTRLKTIIIFLFLLLAVSSVSNLSINGEGDDTSNPYGEGNWELHRGSFNIIHKNGTELEQRHESFALSKISSKILKENGTWARIRISWDEKDLNNRYWMSHDLDYYENITINVRKSNNMAFIESSNKQIGFNPFYVYEYTNTKMTNEGNGKVTLDLDKKYEAYYVSKSSENIHSLLGFQSKKELRYTRLQFGNDPIAKRSKLSLNAKGHYPSWYSVYLPAEYILKNCTSEEYVCLGASIGSGQHKAIEFLKTVDNGGEPSYLNRFPWVLVAIPILLVISTFFGYMAYKNKK